MNREDTINANIGLVHSCCKRFVGRGIEYDDLFQAGCMGLVKAVDGFDETYGLRLSTYAVPVILGEIRRLFRDGGSVKISRSLKELALKVANARSELSTDLGHEPTVSELANHLKISVESITEAVCAMRPTVSLTYDSDGDEVQLDLPSSSYEEALTDKIAVGQLLKTLPERDKHLIECRYFRYLTQQKTADILGMTQVQVSRQEKRILKNLRNQLKLTK